MKKIIALLSVFAIMMACTAASADQGVVSLDDSLFKTAKKALTYFDSGDFDSAAELLGFADSDELSKFVSGNFTTIGSGVQTNVSVAYWCGKNWCVAVPLSEPSKSDVEVLVLNSNDGESFNGYEYTTWGDVESEYTQCDYVTWNEEYISSTPYVVDEN